MTDKSHLIISELINIYQIHYGNVWIKNIHKPIIPSPIKYLSLKYDISIDYIYDIHNQMIKYYKSVDYKSIATK
jgi:hypothetical protein